MAGYNLHYSGKSYWLVDNEENRRQLLTIPDTERILFAFAFGGITKLSRRSTATTGIKIRQEELIISCFSMAVDFIFTREQTAADLVQAMKLREWISV